MSSRQRWTEKEDAVLKLLYPKGGYEAVRHDLPDRSRGSILQRATALRVTNPAKRAAPKMTLQQCAAKFAARPAAGAGQHAAPPPADPPPETAPPEALRVLRVLTEWICRQPAGALVGADRADVSLALTRARRLLNGTD